MQRRPSDDFGERFLADLDKGREYREQIRRAGCIWDGDGHHWDCVYQLHASGQWGRQ